MRWYHVEKVVGMPCLCGPLTYILMTRWWSCDGVLQRDAKEKRRKGEETKQETERHTLEHSRPEQS
jgi:hypothetical protein